MTDDTARTGTIIDDELLPEPFGQPLRNDAAHDVASAAGLSRHMKCTGRLGQTSGAACACAANGRAAINARSKSARIIAA